MFSVISFSFSSIIIVHPLISFTSIIIAYSLLFPSSLHFLHSLLRYLTCILLPYLIIFFHHHIFNSLTLLPCSLLSLLLILLHHHISLPPFLSLLPYLVPSALQGLIDHIDRDLTFALETEHGTYTCTYTHVYIHHEVSQICLEIKWIPVAFFYRDSFPFFPVLFFWLLPCPALPCPALPYPTLPCPLLLLRTSYVVISCTTPTFLSQLLPSSQHSYSYLPLIYRCAKEWRQQLRWRASVHYMQPWNATGPPYQRRGA